MRGRIIVRMREDWLTEIRLPDEAEPVVLSPGDEVQITPSTDVVVHRNPPAYNEDLDTASAPAAVRSLRQAIATADAVIIATPEYKCSVPGALKNALDWASRPGRTQAARQAGERDRRQRGSVRRGLGTR